MNKTEITKHELVQFYMNQLKTFLKKGIGNKTDNGVVITEVLIEATMRRKRQLQEQIRNEGTI